MFNFFKKLTLVFKSDCQHDFIELGRSLKNYPNGNSVYIVRQKCINCGFLTSKIEK